MSYKLVWEGDSQTIGTAGGGTTLPAHVLALLSSAPSSSTVVAASGETLADIATEASSEVDSLFDPDQRSILVLWAGTNDIFFGASGATTYGRLVTYCEARKAAHPAWKIVVLTCLPRSQDGTPVGYETARQTYNASTLAGYADWCDALVDIAADARIGDAGDSDDPTYYDDLVHLNDAGRAIVAELVAAAIDDLATRQFATSVGVAAVLAVG